MKQMPMISCLLVTQGLYPSYICCRVAACLYSPARSGWLLFVRSVARGGGASTSVCNPFKEAPLLSLEKIAFVLRKLLRVDQRQTHDAEMLDAGFYTRAQLRGGS
jgi:hypothetical protein